MKTTNLGFPNVHKSLIKKAVEGLWSGTRTIDDVVAAENTVLEFNAKAQVSLDLIPIGDVDLYDRLLRTAVTFGIVPKRFGTAQEVNDNLELYLSIGRGTQEAPASPMTKWFNTNYHVVVPEIEKEPHLVDNPRIQQPVLDTSKYALIGPATLLHYAQNKSSLSKTHLLCSLYKNYHEFIKELPSDVIQLEEPAFVLEGIPSGYSKFLADIDKEVHLHTYFRSAHEIAPELFRLPVEGIGLDFTSDDGNLKMLAQFPSEKKLIAGVINGRNVHPASTRTNEIVDIIINHIPDDRLYISPSTSLLHVPIDSQQEPDPQARKLSFAVQKIDELASIKDGTIRYKQISIPDVNLPEEEYRRTNPYWTSPIAFPTTTIGSFPQTPELRTERRKFKTGNINIAAYQNYILESIRDCIHKQEEIGLDLLVHGEFERNDMVQYFAELLDGYTVIISPVQSYGTRHVRPPVITGNVSRERSLGFEYVVYAQSLTTKHVKGMLTGPVTMVQWSYPREDIPIEAQYYQLAKAIGLEVGELSDCGIKHIQIDEPAIREGLPLDHARKDHYLKHATNAFRLTHYQTPSNVVIHSHICFSQFADILDALSDLEVDVLSIEDSKSHGKTALEIVDGGYERSLGLGVFDVHSNRIPTIEEMKKIPKHLLENGHDPRKIWINPDCGLKTRGEETYEQLRNMVKVAHQLRKDYEQRV